MQEGSVQAICCRRGRALAKRFSRHTRLASSSSTAMACRCLARKQLRHTGLQFLDSCQAVVQHRPGRAMYQLDTWDVDWQSFVEVLAHGAGLQLVVQPPTLLWVLQPISIGS